MKFANYILFIFLLLDACIEPFTAKVPDGQELLVIDGMITDQPGPYTVTIYNSLPLNEQVETQWLRGANVKITDDAGNLETLTERSPGHYATSTTQGVIGREYTLHITTSEGNTYKSDPEKMLPVGDFSNIVATFETKIPATLEDPKSPRNGFNIFIDANVDPEQNGLARWRWNGTFELTTNPELRTKSSMGAVIVQLPDPPPCSGYVVPRGNTMAIEKTGDCTCCSCWVTQYGDTPLLSNVKMLNDNQVKNLNVAYIPANRRFFEVKYYLIIEELSLSPASYKFWQTVAAQEKSSSDLFQTPPPATVGNIHATSPGGLTAVGVFSASAIAQHAYTLLPGAIPYSLPLPDTIAIPCQSAYPHSVNTKPSFW